MRLFADENILVPTISFLRDLGHDVRGVEDVDLGSAPDEAIFAHARQHGRVLLTYNEDFVDLRELVGVQHPGIIRLRIRNQRAWHVHPILQAALEHLVATDMKNTLVTVSDHRVRIRRTDSL
jgi:predicted nuclease of predicted toxin-antitoxin system